MKPLWLREENGCVLAREGLGRGDSLCSLSSALEKSAWCLGKIKGSRIAIPVLTLLLSV